MSQIHLLGSSGFIGQAVQRRADSDRLVCWSHQRDSAHCFDLLDSQTWASLLAEKPTKLILLSWPGLPNYNKPFHVTENLPAAVSLVSQLIDNGLERIVVAGTCYEYGLANGALEEDQPTNPINFYAIAKDALRRSVAQICSGSNTSWCWLRIFYPYGPGQSPTSLLPSLERAIAAGQPKFAMGSGRQIRDYVPVEHVADHLLLLADHPKALGLYNSGSGVPRSLREIVEGRVADASSSIHLAFGDLADRSDEPIAFWASLDRISSLSV